MAQVAQACLELALGSQVCLPFLILRLLTLYSAKEADRLGCATSFWKATSGLGLELCFIFFRVDALFFVFAGVGLLLRGPDHVRQG